MIQGRGYLFLIWWYRIFEIPGAVGRTKKFFYSTTPDIEYLSRVIYDWVVKNSRLQSRKYLVGESYGGYRGPRITHYLQSRLGAAMNGVVWFHRI